MVSNTFSWKNFALVLVLTCVVGIGEYAVVYQFNDGKISQREIGAIFLGMCLPSLLIGGVMRMFRPNLQRYFAITIGLCATIGLFLIFA